MGFMYQTCFKHIDERETMLLIQEQQILQRMINSYEERWRDLAPTISIKTQQNRATGKPEVNFCRKRFHIQHHKRILKERYMHAVQCTQRRCAKQNLPQVREEHSAHHRLPEADKFLESYHREKTRDERQLARLQARE
ncbi:hypothetical protein C0J52_27009 [Blattella germanica]|nr:hypothetical protein C0J52_27009 [Blattella germanica]